MKNEIHHYIPKFYLKNFSIKKKNNYYLNCFLKRNSKIFYTNIRNIAGSKNFYGSYDIFEGNVSNVIRKIIQNEGLSLLSQDERKELSYFASSLLIRTKHHRNMMGRLLTDLMHRMSPHFSSNFDISKYNFKITSEGHLDFMTHSIEELSKRLTKLKWILFINNTNIPFWTSDNPITIENKLKSKPGFSNLGLACRGIQVNLPLNSKIIISFLDPKEFSNFPGIFDLFDEEGVIHENYLQVYFSEDMVFSESNYFLLAKQVLYIQPELKEGCGMSMRLM